MERTRKHDRDATGVRIGGSTAELVMFLIHMFASFGGVSRDIVRVIIAKYQQMVPPLIACCHGLMVIVTDLEIIWGNPEDIEIRSHSSGEWNDHSWKYCDGCEIPCDIPAMNKYRPDHTIRTVACGLGFAIAATDHGFYSWGASGRRCLGRFVCGSIEWSDWANHRPDRPVYVPTAGNVITIACGACHVMMIVTMHGVRRLYGWGDIMALGVKCMFPMIECEIRYYDSPHYIDIADPDAISCGDNYSLVLALGCVWLCGIDKDSGEWTCAGPQKLEWTNVIGIFACCNRYAVRVAVPGVPDDGGLGFSNADNAGKYLSRPDNSRPPDDMNTIEGTAADGRCAKFVVYCGMSIDADCCGLNERYLCENPACKNECTDVGCKKYSRLPRRLVNQRYASTFAKLSVIDGWPISCWIEDTLDDIGSRGSWRDRICAAKTHAHVRDEGLGFSMHPEPLNGDGNDFDDLRNVVDIAGNRDTMLLAVDGGIYLIFKKHFVGKVYSWY
jgi:hypothetical protein